MITTYLTIFTLYIILIASPVQSDCIPNEIIIEDVGLNLTTTTDLDPFLMDHNVSANTTIFIKNNSTENCSDLYLLFQDLLTPEIMTAPGSSDQIPFSLTKSGQNTSLINHPNGITINEINAGARIPITLNMRILPISTAITPANPYSNTNTNLILMANNIGVLDSSKKLEITTRVDTQLDINIGGADYTPNSTSTYYMQFGTVQTNDSRNVAVTIRANVDHILRITSENHGVMRGPQPLTNYAMTYRAELDNTTLNLTNEASLALGNRTSIYGNSHNLKITITSDNSIHTGNYHDVLTLTVIVAP